MLQDSLYIAHEPPGSRDLAPAPSAQAEGAGKAYPQVEAAADSAAEQTTAVAITDGLGPLPRDGEPDFLPRCLTPKAWEYGLASGERCELLKQLDSASGRPAPIRTDRLVRDGEAGTPLPYRFRNDDIVTSLLMVSFFLVVWVITNSRHYLHETLKNFFRTRERDNMFAERTEKELQGQVFMVFETCFVLGILFFDYTQHRLPEVFNNVSPYRILGVATGICTLYYLLKMGLYAFVNHVFFDRSRNRLWNEAYVLSILALGLALLPVTLLVVYFGLSFAHLSLLFFGVLLVVKALLFYKCFSIFFNQIGRGVHLILYFCTLEIVPLLVLWRALVYASRLLLLII